MSRKFSMDPAFLLEDPDAKPETLPLTDKQKQELVDKQAEILRANNAFVATIKPLNLSESDDSDDDMYTDFDD